jgi:hypothetical protein
MNVLSKFARSLGCVLALAAATACGGSEDGVPIESSVTKLALTVATTDEALVAVRSEGAAISVDEVGVSLRSIGIVPCASDASAIAIDDYAVELTVEPATQANFESSVHDYCGVELDIEPSSSDDPPELAELAVFVRGTRSDDTPFEIRSELELEATFSSEAAFGAHAVLGFDLATWFSGVELDAAGATDGVVLIDGDENEDLLAAFEANTRGAVALYVDADRDGVLDADELEPIATGE